MNSTADLADPPLVTANVHRRCKLAPRYEDKAEFTHVGFDVSEFKVQRRIPLADHSEPWDRCALGGVELVGQLALPCIKPAAFYVPLSSPGHRPMAASRCS